LLSRADCRQTFLYRITEGLPVVRTWLHHSFRTALESTIQCDTCVLRFMTAFELCIHDLTDSELKASIERFASDLNGHGATGFVAERKGGNDSLQAHVVEEIFCIAREALTNAFRHSEAPRIVVELDYQKRKFVFSCRDNGRGFGPVALQASHRRSLGPSRHGGARGKNWCQVFLREYARQGHRCPRSCAGSPSLCQSPGIPDIFAGRASRIGSDSRPSGWLFDCRTSTKSH